MAPLRARLASLLRPAGLKRRQVTVLFADVVGSTAMAQAMDAEDALDVISGALRRMAALVEAHHGRVLRFTGDGVKAAFGFTRRSTATSQCTCRSDCARPRGPGAPARAECRWVGQAVAGLEALRRRSDNEAAAPVMIGHGRLRDAARQVVRGGGVEHDHSLSGLAVNITARMEQAAPPGALRISMDTYRQVQSCFDVLEQPALQVKGMHEPT